MTDTDTPVTPALPEPVAYAYLTPHSGTVYALSKTKSEQCPDGLVPAAQMQEALDRAASAEAAIHAARDAHLSIVRECEDRAARDESALESALERIDDLERDAERVSNEFEGDCWSAMLALLNECSYDWGWTEPDGVTAEDAREHISTTIAYWKARASAAETALAEAHNDALGKAAQALAAAPYSKPSDVEETGLFSIPTTREDLVAIVLALKTKEINNADR